MSYGQVVGTMSATRIGRGTIKLALANIANSSGLSLAGNSLIIADAGIYSLSIQLSCSGATRETEITLALVNEGTGGTVGTSAQRVTALPSSPEDLTIVFAFTQTLANQPYGLYLTVDGAGEASYLLLLSALSVVLSTLSPVGGGGGGGDATTLQGHPASDFAPVACGVSSGDGHNHTGGAGAPITDASIPPGAAIAEAKLALNFATHGNANDPTVDQKAALAGTSGTPSASNPYATSEDFGMFVGFLAGLRL